MGVSAGRSRRPIENEQAVEAGPIYIGGLDRSGKTTMRALLASHPRIAIPDVGSNMWTYFYRRYGSLASDANLDACLQAMSKYKHVRFMQPDIERISRDFRNGDRTYARLFSLFLRQYADRMGKPRWGAQTGLIERYATELFDSYPGVRMIHMLRDPRDRYEASLAMWPSGKGGAGAAVARWRYSENLARRHEKQWPDRYRVIRFEDLVSRPEETLSSVCAFLGEDYYVGMLHMEAGERHREKLASGSTKPQVLSNEFIGRFREHLPREHIAFIQIQLGRAMIRRGYELESVEFDMRDRLAFAVRSFPDQTARMLAWRSVEALQETMPRHVARRPGKRMLVEDPA